MIILSIAVFLLINNSRGENTEPILTNEGEVASEETQNFSYKEDLSGSENPSAINLKIEFDAKTYSYDLKVNEGENLFDVMNRLAETSEYFSFEYDAYDFGVMITGINNFIPDPNISFWKLIVNGEDAQTGVKDIKVKNGDSFEFKTEVIKF